MIVSDKQPPKAHLKGDKTAIVVANMLPLLFLLCLVVGAQGQGLLSGLFGGGGGGGQGNQGGLVGEIIAVFGRLGNLIQRQNGGWGLFGGQQNQGGPWGQLGRQPNGQGGPGQGGLLGGLLGGGGRGGQPGGPGMQNGGGLLGGLLGGAKGNPALMETIQQIVNIPVSIIHSATQVDVVTDLAQLKGGPPPSQRDWDRKARKFCRRFPGHPNCRGNQVPMYSQLDDLLGSIMGSVSNLLPKVPIVNIKDPLKGVDSSLVKSLGSVTTKLGHIEGHAKKHMESACTRLSCKKQPPKALLQKQLVEAKIFEFEKAKLGKDKSDQIQLRFDRTQQLKEALLERANLSHTVVPADNGVFDNDILLTEKQANFLLNELGKGGVGAESVPHPELFDPSNDAKLTRRQRRERDERLKRASVFFEEDPVKQWNPYQPIPYYLDDSLENFEKDDVRGAISEIQSKTCLRFQELKNAGTTGYMHYYKVDSATFCGLSYVGKADPANPIYLSFGCQNNRGVALHETMHALGVAHQHLRTDRDQFIQIDWSNVNPQMYDSFVVVDAKLYTSYGVKYDYGSIMHYNAYTAAIDTKKETMKPKFDFANNVRKLGQRDGMSKADVELLNKMYCQPGCEDRNVYCGSWALQNLCPTNNWVRQNCLKSCNQCFNGKK